MPIHDWTVVDAGIFHHFHQGWTMELSNALNDRILPPGYFALAEQIIGGPMPDVIALQHRESMFNVASKVANESGAVAVAESPPRAKFVLTANAEPYAARANRIMIRHQLGEVVAVIEIVSPGNKGSRNALRNFVAKTSELLRSGISLLVVDLFPPSSRDPAGIHKAIWDDIREESFAPPADKPLTAAAYCAAEPLVAYVEPLAVGDSLPSLPIFLDSETYVPAPLESTYQANWDKCPTIVKELVSGNKA